MNTGIKLGNRETAQTMITDYNCPSFEESYTNITHAKMRAVSGPEIGTVV